MIVRICETLPWAALPISICKTGGQIKAIHVCVAKIHFRIFWHLTASPWSTSLCFAGTTTFIAAISRPTPTAHQVKPSPSHAPPVLPVFYQEVAKVAHLFLLIGRSGRAGMQLQHATLLARVVSLDRTQIWLYTEGTQWWSDFRCRWLRIRQAFQPPVYLAGYSRTRDAESPAPTVCPSPRGTHVSSGDDATALDSNHTMHIVS